MELNNDLLNIFGNSINWLIFLYILSTTINTKCLNLFQQLVSLAGILVSIYISLITSKYFKNYSR
jgi:hypothetical protein